MKKLLILCSFIAIFSCKTESTSTPPPPAPVELKTYAATDFKEEVDGLASNSARSIYLEKIYRKDQKVRKAEQKAIQDFGYNSKEHLEAKHDFMQSDLINFAKIEQFLETHPYPGVNQEGAEAAAAPFIVVHHNMNLEYRNKHFKPLYEAWKKKNISDGEMALYLNRSHKIKFGEMFNMPNPFTREAQIDSLAKRLELL